ncbi:MAG: hypothetical protein HGN29_09640 [Asgard group archaeon]|nr:hypothetical protein [Asgard group archaeon]
MKNSSSFSKLIFLILLYFLFISTINALSVQDTSQSFNDNSIRSNLNVKEKESFAYSYTPHEPIDITYDAGFSFYGFPGSGTEADPYIIEGYNITTTTTELPRLAISITDTTKHFVIRNCYVNTNATYWGWGGRGIRILYTAYGTVSILNNHITGNSDGIFLSGCAGSIVSNNFCLGNSNAIELTSCPQSIVNNNTCNFNGEGIEFSECSDTVVFDNTCENNYGPGIELYGEMENCLVYDNHIKGSTRFAITIQIQSSKNFIFRNTFIDNNIGGTSQAEDNGKRNKWYNPETEEGNYWSDLGEECKYSIDGYSNSKDLYPLNRAETCSNPKVGSTLAIVLPILAGAAILAFIIPKYIIPYHREKNLWKSFKRFINKYKKVIYGLLVILFIVGGFVLFIGLMKYLWTADIDAALITGATICSSIVGIVISLGITKALKPKKEVEIKQDE